MATVTERVSHIEGELKHFATKADLERMEKRLYVAMVILVGTSASIAFAIARLI